MYEPRLYRENMNTNRFDAVTVSVKETDLWVGCSEIEQKELFRIDLLRRLPEIRQEIEDFIENNPEFGSAHQPIEPVLCSSKTVRSMLKASHKAKVGPMAAVAGAISQRVGRYIRDKYHPDETVVENGGDIYLKVKNDIVISPYIGKPGNNEQIKVLIPGGTECGICTSSGTIGHSYSYGNSDAVTVISSEPATADAYATGIANKIKSKDDINRVAKEYQAVGDIDALCIVVEDTIAYQGKYELIF